MLAYRTVATARVAGGAELVLARRDREWCVRVDGKILMSSRQHDSEESLAHEALARVAQPEAVLVGGLGLGFTLRAVLDRVSPQARVTVGELVPELVDWNRAELAELHQSALDDPRCDVVVGDVFGLIQRSRAAFDAILLDIDNGPVALAQAENAQLYGRRGLAQCHAALRPSGVLAVWSAGPSAPFEAQIAQAGFALEVLTVPARRGKGARHTLFVARRR
jgi:spermidine synthase